MPQAADSYGFSDDGDAFSEISNKRFCVRRGGVIVATEGVTPTRREQEALMYLCGEWDYAYEGPWPEYLRGVQIQ